MNRPSVEYDFTADIDNDGLDEEDTNEIFTDTPDKDYLPEMCRWFAGEGFLFAFDHTPDNEAEYYVTLDLTINYTSPGGVFQTDKRLTIQYGPYESPVFKVSGLSSQKTVDADQNDVTNAYDGLSDLSKERITGLTLTPVSDTEIDVNWTPSTNRAVKGYYIDYISDGLAHRWGSLTSPFRLGGLKRNTPYCIDVMARMKRGPYLSPQALAHGHWRSYQIMTLLRIQRTWS